MAKLVLTSRLESAAWKISCENSSRNTVPSDADSRAATFLIRRAGKIYFQSDGRAREEDTTSSTTCARLRCSFPTVVLRCGAGGGEARQENQRRAENDQLAWPAAAATMSGITLIRVKKRNFP